MPNPAKPLEVKRHLGNPGKRGLPKEGAIIALNGGYVAPHQPLEWAGQLLWDRVFNNGGLWISPQTDVEALLLVCKQLDRQARIESALVDKPDDTGLLRQLLDLEKAIMSGLGQLGFTVDARSKLGLAEVKRQSKLEQLKAKHG